MFYELDHPMDARYFKIQRDRNLKFPVHIHHCFELICVTEGELQITVDEMTHTVGRGEGVLVFPNQMHSIETHTSSRDVLLIFSRELVGTFAKLVDKKVPEDNRFVLNDVLLTLVDSVSELDGIISIKGLLYSLCGAFHRTASYRESSLGSSVLLYRMFKFVEQNYNVDCTLDSLSRELGYEYTYLSRYFKRSVGISYNYYVNEYRISRVCYYLTGSDKTVLEISDECGFNSLRSLNRNFKNRLGVTPSEYRRQKMIITEVQTEV